MGLRDFFARKESEDHWTRREHLIDPEEFVCSVCGGSSDQPYGNCPNCGAALRRVEYDPCYIDEAEWLDEVLEEDD